jgi:glutathione S-transferase
MILHFTATSPYARVVRATIRLKGLEARVEEVIAKTRLAGSPYYEVNASGRVPYLVRDDGLGLEDSQLICHYLESLAPNPRVCRPFAEGDWRVGRLETYARSFTDGVSVWVREMRRPEGERSPTIVAHEAERARRLADFWEDEIADPLIGSTPDMAQLLLVSGIDFAIISDMLDPLAGRPRLTAWHRRLYRHAAVRATSPLPPERMPPADGESA